MAEQGGLLDFMNTPEGQGLLAAAFSGLANARRGAPLNTIGAAGLSGLMGYSGAQDRQRQQAQAQSTQEMNALQMQRLRRELEAPPAPTVYKPGDVVYQNGEMQFQVPKEPDLPTSVREFEYAKQNGFNGSFEDFKKITNSTTPFTSPIATDRGYMGFNTRTGEITPLMDRAGNPLLPAAQSPILQGQIAGARTSATETAKKEAEAAFDAPVAIAKGEEALGLVDDLLKAPGFKTAVGTSRMFGLQKIPGTDARNFDIRLDQIKGQQFLQAFETLKGGGQITEVEGRKATDAISRMNPEASEAEFKKAANEFKAIIQRGIERAKKQGGMTTPSTPSSGGVRSQAVDWSNLK